MTARELAMKVIRRYSGDNRVHGYRRIGTNLYLWQGGHGCGAKHTKADVNGVRIAELNRQVIGSALEPPSFDGFLARGTGAMPEESWRKWAFIPWRYCQRCLPLGRPNDYYNEDLLYRLFGVNAF